MSFDILYLPTLLLVTLAIVFIYRRYLSPPYLKAFIVYLLITLLIEVAAHIAILHNQRNIGIYNFGMFFEISFFAYIYFKTLNGNISKKIIQWFYVFFFVFFFVNLLLIQGLSSFSSNSYIAGCLFFVCTCFYYLFFQVTKNQSRNPVRDFMFWVTIGILFCYLGNLPYLLSLNALHINNQALLVNLSIVSKVVNTLLYLLIIVGTLCQIRN